MSAFLAFATLTDDVTLTSPRRRNKRERDFTAAGFMSILSRLSATQWYSVLEAANDLQVNKYGDTWDFHWI